MLPVQQEVQVAIATAFAFAALRIRNAGFADATQAGNHSAAIRPAEEFGLNRSQDGVRVVAGNLQELSAEWARFDELHSVISNTLW